MSHVDEGALHAYLDGALEEYPTGEARRIRAHLERCERCARALADARKSRDEADLLLAIPQVDVSAPPLEELRTLARSDAEPVKAPPRGLRLYRFGWAASVVLALGVGWMLRGGVPEASRPSVTEALSPSGAPAVGEERGGSLAEVPAGASAERAQVDVAMDEAPVASVAEAPPARQEGRMAEAVPAETTLPEPPGMDATVVEMAEIDVSEAEEALADMADLDLIEERSVPAESLTAPAGAPDVGVGALAAEEEVMVADATGAGEPDEAAGGSVPAAPERSALAARSAGVSSALQVEGFTARERESQRVSADDVAEPGSLVVPGLEVVSIVWREEGVVPAGVRVLQRLPDGGSLELIHLPAGFDPGAVEPAASGTGELVVPRDQGWLILRGPLSEEEFRSLLERMDAPVPDS